MLSTLRGLFGSTPKPFKYEDDLITFVLPGVWVREDDLSVRVSLLSEDQTTRYMVSLHRVGEPMSPSESRLQQVEVLASMRRQALERLSTGQVKIGEPQIHQLNDKLFYDFMAKSTEPRVQMYFRFLQRGDLVATFALYDSSGRNSEEHVQLLREAFSATVIK